jgi:hypothetical protein
MYGPLLTRLLRRMNEHRLTDDFCDDDDGARPSQVFGHGHIIMEYMLSIFIFD